MDKNNHQSRIEKPDSPGMLYKSIFFLLIGAGTLILETVWLKKQLIDFGNAPSSYGSILFAYFVGIGLGSLYFDKIGSISRQKLYILFPASLLCSFLLPWICFEFAPGLLQNIFPTPLVYNGVKWTIAAISLIPVCFFLGGFFPLVGRDVNSRQFVLLYGIQTIGALFGVWLGAFYLPYTFGYRITFIIAAIIILSSLAFFRAPKARTANPNIKSNRTVRNSRFDFIALCGGFFALMLQVVWIRFIAIGTDNSIFAFNSVSLIIIALIALASTVLFFVPPQVYKSKNLFHVIQALSLIGVISSIYIFVANTGGLCITMFNNTSGLWKSLRFALPFVATGYLFPSFIFPFLIRHYHSIHQFSDTESKVGRLIALNSFGCAAGSLLTSFFLLPYAGIWITSLICFLGYALFPVLLDWNPKRIIGVIAAIVVVFIVNPLNNPLVTPTNPFDQSTEATGRVVSVKEGKFGIVSVIDYAENMRSLWLNNSYLLEAGMNNVQGACRMGILPTLLNPSAEKLAMIGVGTGITASGFLNSNVKQIRLVELIPEVIKDADSYFQSYNRNVLHDPRVHAVVADGRQYLKMQQDHFDIIVSDLFTPWNEGTSYLYTADHFAAIKSKLTHNGIFMLWLPSYQLTEYEFDIIAKTFASVFPRATLWQLEVSTDVGVLGLVGCSGQFPIEDINAAIARRVSPDPSLRLDIIEMHKSGLFSRYIGPVTFDNEEWKNIPINTLDKPILEFAAAQQGRKILKDEGYIALVKKFYQLPANRDKMYFTAFDSSMEQYRQSGLLLNQSYLSRKLGDIQKSHEFYEQACAMTPALLMAR